MGPYTLSICIIHTNVTIDGRVGDDNVWLPLCVTQCLSLPSLEVGNLSSVFHLTSCLLPPTLSITGPGHMTHYYCQYYHFFIVKLNNDSPPINLLATIKNGDGGLSGPSGPGLKSSSFICKWTCQSGASENNFTQRRS